MKPNIGTINALIRITCGFTMLAWIIPKMVWKPYRESNLLIAIIGSMKIAEGITRFCPLTLLLKEYVNSDMFEEKEKNQNIRIDPS
jgi:hypothetical protein